ncbi:zinc-binding dehydrogenase [Saccharopolyspora hirsuta]|uniref:Zinc-binding dehydrogenase n=1 Tax=Saccharopolyspora hirsuta TaxID=1837 RepID=A0A5M7CE32_SACHI|nr:zinc-binding dehydrogenase [Saccharopolyspora hirsuta]KAA5837924.1 zinc-binding dehydrogenase [Saccharopolyspora hirsuta]
MKAVLLPGEREVRVVEREVPRPGPGEVLVRTRASAICRSDMSLYTGNPIVGGDAAGRGLVVPGHEPAGDVVETGPGVTGLALGDRVTGYLAIGCMRCEHCRGGRLMLCPRWKCLGFDVDGGDAEYFVAPAVNCLPLPDELSYTAGALLTDMVGTQYATQKSLAVGGATTLAVFGMGPMGGAAVLVGKALGATVLAVDLLDERLALARELGADAVVNSGSDDAVARLRELTGGRGPDVVVECSGAPPAQNSALDCVRKLGSVAFVGESRQTTINPSDQIIRKLLRVTGGWYFPIDQFAELSRFAVQHALPIERLVSHRYQLDDAPEAFRAFDRRLTDKAVFTWD